MESGQACREELAKVTFTKDIASFANASGGVLIIGVSDQREILGIADNAKDVENRLKVAKETIAKYLDYKRDIVRFHQVVLPDKSGNTKICLAIIVAQAYESVAVSDGNGRYMYPICRETGIQLVSRDKLFSRIHMKSDKYDFLSDLEQFIRED